MVPHQACPQRTAVTPPPSSLPFSCMPENNAKMREWLLDKYAASTFNTCPHRSLHCMAGPPVEIHMGTLAKPIACHTPSPHTSSLAAENSRQPHP